MLFGYTINKRAIFPIGMGFLWLILVFLVVVMSKHGMPNFLKGDRPERAKRTSPEIEQMLAEEAGEAPQAVQDQRTYRNLGEAHRAATNEFNAARNKAESDFRSTQSRIQDEFDEAVSQVAGDFYKTNR